MDSDIQTASTADIPIIRNIAHEVWPATYSGIISPEQIEYMLEVMYSPESLQKQMTTEGCEFLLALSDGLPSGFAAYSLLREEGKEKLFKLHKLYVLTTAQGFGLGRRLMDEVCARAGRRGGTRLELQVNKTNAARDFYRRQGFEIERELVLDIGHGFIMDDYIMSRIL